MLEKIEAVVRWIEEGAGSEVPEAIQEHVAHIRKILDAYVPTDVSSVPDEWRWVGKVLGLNPKGDRNKIKIIKIVRILWGMGLKEAKEWVEMKRTTGHPRAHWYVTQYEARVLAQLGMHIVTIDPTERGVLYSAYPNGGPLDHQTMSVVSTEAAKEGISMTAPLPLDRAGGGRSGRRTRRRP